MADLDNEKWIEITKKYGELYYARQHLVVNKGYEDKSYDSVNAVYLAQVMRDIDRFYVLTNDLSTDERERLFLKEDLKHLEELCELLLEQKK